MIRTHHRHFFTAAMQEVFLSSGTGEGSHGVVVAGNGKKAHAVFIGVFSQNVSQGLHIGGLAVIRKISGQRHQLNAFGSNLIQCCAKYKVVFIKQPGTGELCLHAAHQHRRLCSLRAAT